MEEWKEYNISNAPRYPLVDLLDFIVDNRGKTVPTASTGTALIATNCIRNEYLYPIYEKIRFVSDEIYKSWFRAHPQPGDIIFVNKGTPGKTALVPDPVDFCIAQDMMAFRVNENLVYNKYLLAILRSKEIQQFILNSQVGTIIPHFKKEQLKSLMIPLPSKDIQFKIGDLYYKISKKIEVNRKINENLEQQAQALFKSWFVDFEPFKNQPFVESELGMIPQGWRVGTLGDICVTNKRTYKGDFVSEIEYIDTGCVTNNIIDTPQILNPAIDKIPSRARRAVTEGDIIYSSVRPNQRHYALLFNPSSNTVVSTGFVVITANWSGYRYYIYQYLIQDEIVNKLQAIAEQSVSTFPSLNASDLTNLKIVIPPNDVVGDFAALNCSFITQINKKQQESRRLAELRDTLLPRLMSGELKVNDLENNEI